MADDLYEQDFYLWTLAQAEALRAHARASNVLDYDNLAEEVEGLGRSERSKASSLTFRIIQHLYKLSATQNSQVTGDWRGEVITWRVDLAHVLTQAIRNELDAELEQLHRKGEKAAQASMDHHEPEVLIDPSLRWTVQQIMGEADDPLAAFERQDRPVS